MAVGPDVELGSGTAQFTSMEFYNTAGGYGIANGTMRVSHGFFNYHPGTTNTISADLTGSSNALRIVSSGDAAPIIVTGDIFETLGSSPLILYGSFELAGTATHTGRTLLSKTARLFGASGSALLSNEWEVKRGTLTLDNSASAVQDRMSDTATLLLRHGTLELLGNAAVTNPATIYLTSSSVGCLM